MKKVAYLCSEYPAISQTFIFREIKSLRAAGHEVTAFSVHSQSHLDVMTEDERKEASGTLVMTSLSVFSILASHLGIMLSSPAGYFRMIAGALSLLIRGPKSPFKALAYFTEAGILVRWMRKKKISHVHEHFGAPTALVAMLAGRYGKIDYSLSIHGPDVFFTQDAGLLREKVISAKFIRCISHFCRSQLMRITPHEHWKNLHIVRCGVDPDNYSPAPERNNAVPGILCVGRLVPAKGQHILLQACRQLKNENIPFTMTFVGEGEDRDSLEKYSREEGLTDQVFFAGAQGQDKIQNYYNSADIFALPSFAEGVPVVLMEAMSKELPVISTYIAGIPELIKHNQTGLLADAGDVESLALNLKRLISDPLLRAELGAAGRNQVMARYHLHNNNKKMASLFS